MNIDKWARRANRHASVVGELSNRVANEIKDDLLRAVLLAMLTAIHCNLMLSIALYQRSNEPTKL